MQSSLSATDLFTPALHSICTSDVACSEAASTFNKSQNAFFELFIHVQKANSELCECNAHVCGESILVLWLGLCPSLAPTLDQAALLKGGVEVGE